MALSVVILAAGNGKRMLSSLPKVIHPLGGIPLLSHVIKTAQSLQPDAIYVVYGNGGNHVREALKDAEVNWVEQIEPKGTGHALLQALPFIEDHQQVLILYGDVPLIKQTTLQQLLTATKSNWLGLLVAQFNDPSGLGRIIRNENNEIIAIIEQKDASKEQLEIKEVNTGIMTGAASYFKKWLPQLRDENAQGEYYLTDVIAMAVSEQVGVTGVTVFCNWEVSGVNHRKELAALERYYQFEKAQELMLQGAMIMDPARFDCRGVVEVTKDVIIDINVILEGTVSIAEGSRVGAHSILKNVKLGKNVIIHPHCVIEDAKIGDHCIIGPFARIRPHSVLEEEVHIGNFVELKNSKIGQGTKANHLSYLGDANIGKHVNVGAGTITCNYDGYHKYPTTIDDGAFIGSGSELIAPIKVGKNAYIGAGTTLTRDAPDEQLTLGRAKQVTVKGWKRDK